MRHKAPSPVSSAITYLFLLILFFLLLKAFKVLPDPPEYLEVAASIGAAIGVVSFFGMTFNYIYKLQGRTATIETKVTAIENDVKKIWNKLETIESKIS